ncbi:hypothetical protein O3P69_008124 [Scylla paramamosain]|uniref:Uncharacterized protein n=1 Tax=Scylla paramamosain TaxID=85552 RepID=A0AAW0T181_SCYPA
MDACLSMARVSLPNRDMCVAAFRGENLLEEMRLTTRPRFDPGRLRKPWGGIGRGGIIGLLRRWLLQDVREWWRGDQEVEEVEEQDQEEQEQEEENHE